MRITEQVKVHFPLEIDEDNFPPINVESLNAFQRNNGEIRLDNTPFFITGVALGDVVRCTVDSSTNGVWFEKVISESGNKALSIIFLETHCKDDVYLQLKKFGCYCEYGEFDGMDMLAVCVYQSEDYSKIASYLDKLELDEWISYAELCI